jgi:hypothetical protein
MTPTAFVGAMNATASYVLARGLLTRVYRHYRWMLAYLTAYYGSATPLELASRQHELHVPLANRLVAGAARRLLSGSLSRATILRIILPTIYLVGAVQQAVGSLLPGLVVGGSRAVWESAKLMLRNVPVALATVVIVFFTGDSWKILGEGFSWRFFGLGGFFVLTGVAALARRSDLQTATRFEDHELVELANDTPAGALIAAGVQPVALEQVDVATRVNIGVLYVLAVTLNMFMAGVLVAAALVAVGVIRIGSSLTKQLSGAQAHVIVHIGSVELTSQLLSLSLSLGGFAALYVAASGLGDDRVRFERRAARDVRRTLAALAVYQSALMRQPSPTRLPAEP